MPDLACQRGLLPVSPALPHSLASGFELPVQALASRSRPTRGKPNTWRSTASRGFGAGNKPAVCRLWFSAFHSEPNGAMVFGLPSP
jgi:hypothetical protein